MTLDSLADAADLLPFKPLVPFKPESIPCRCGGRLYSRGALGSPPQPEWAHHDAVDECDRTLCPDGSRARPL